jgi:hypothetical protein
MMIWKIWQETNDDYDTFCEAIVVAPDAESARRIHPASSSYSSYIWSEDRHCWTHSDGSEVINYDWVLIDDVNVELLGIATGEPKRQVLCASFRAG